VPDATFKRADYREALLALLPRGRVWPKEPGSTHYRLMDGFAPTFERLDRRAQELLFDLFPANTVELLPEWEATLGLPDPCDGEEQTLEQRRNQVLIRLFEGGGQSKTYYLAVLARLGYEDAEIREYAPFRANASVANTPVYSEAWWFVWTVVLPNASVTYFRANASTANEPLFSLSAEAVFCTLAAIKPAHTVVLFEEANLGGQLDFEDPDNSMFLPLV
jgi:uncharacterized protein YmfQ (DUF2313 family)